MRARNAASKADAELPALRFHDLRHSFGTMAVSAGVDVLAVKEWMGHRDVSTTMGYLHHAERSTDADRLSLAFGGQVAEATAGEERPAVAA